MFHQGAKVRRDLPPAKPRIQAARKSYDAIEFSAKNEAYRFALANKKRSWAKRWLRSNGQSF
jgi:hypothetical protein